MKSVLISIQPKWVKKIANGEKTIEVRKSKPKLETPFKCYIYETKDKKYEDIGICGHRKDGTPYNFVNHIGKVIGEFVCDSVEMVNAGCSDYGIDLFYHDCMTKGCLTESEVDKYFNIPEDKDLRAMKGNGYAWHISQLKIYDKPKELSEFTHFQGKDLCCLGCEHEDTCQVSKVENCVYAYKPLTRPPQSWCYVEEREKGEWL